MPYVTHLFSVALLVAEDGAHDDVVTAALLHDTIEDTGTTREEIATAFNERVAELVEAVSEMKKAGEGEDNWRERKLAYIKNLETAPEEAVLIAVADKVDNIESKLGAFLKDGSAFLAHWKRPAEDYLWFHGEALRIAKLRLPRHPLTKRLAEVHAQEKEVLG